jgi:hypothetical protein
MEGVSIKKHKNRFWYPEEESSHRNQDLGAILPDGGRSLFVAHLMWMMMVAINGGKPLLLFVTV